MALVWVWVGSGRWMGCCKGVVRAVTMPSSLSSLATLVTAVQAALVIGVGLQGCGEGGDDNTVVIFGSSHCRCPAGSHC